MSTQLLRQTHNLGDWAYHKRGSTWAQLQVALPPHDLLVVRVVKVPVHHLLCEVERPVEALPDHLHVARHSCAVTPTSARARRIMSLMQSPVAWQRSPCGQGVIGASVGGNAHREAILHGFISVVQVLTLLQPAEGRLCSILRDDCERGLAWSDSQPLELQPLSLQPQPGQSRVGSASHAAAPAAETLSSECLRCRVTFSAPEIDEAART